MKIVFVLIFVCAFIAMAAPQRPDAAFYRPTVNNRPNNNRPIVTAPDSAFYRPSVNPGSNNNRPIVIEPDSAFYRPSANSNNGYRPPAGGEPVHIGPAFVNRPGYNNPYLRSGK
ncbi:uncharacterized protein LOC142979854 isoform X2 [Anticarsia gemmatalis]|uniref:uncharacterized protein LOC142979854 isoform X2 n=1 Tax=Anticarsia gemmatalis TaxID=129554 RepID=UPI003F774024